LPSRSSFDDDDDDDDSAVEYQPAVVSLFAIRTGE